MNIPIFKLEFEKSFLKKFNAGANDILTSNRPLAEGKYVKEFEDAFAHLVGAKYAVAVTNGTVALELALKVLGVGQRTVLVPANTFFATTVAVSNAGGKIGLVDVEEETFSIAPQALRERLAKSKKNKEKIGAVIVVHVGGIISKYIEEIKKICDDFDTPLLEDAAQAQCSSVGRLKAGTIGAFGCFSFFPTKVMTTAEGGIVTTNNKKDYELIKSLKNFGRDNNDAGIIINPGGNNYKVTEFVGLLGVLDCERVKKRVEKRNVLTKVYATRLKGSGYIPVLQERGLSSQYKMILRTSIEREWLRDYCKKNDITLTGEVYKVPIHHQPLYKEMFKKEKFPVTDRIALSHICPPLYPELSVKEINYICDILLKAEKDYEK